jgi:putative phage-type endonuclease
MDLINFKDKAEWLAYRKKRITGTGAATIMGANPYSSPLQLWGEMTGRLEPADLSENQAVQLGIKLEPIVREWFYEETHYESACVLGEFTIVNHPDLDFVGGTPDDIYTDDEHEGILEIKTTGAHLGHLWDSAPPLAAQVQAQLYAACADVKFCAYAVLIGGQTLKSFEQDRNDDFISVMLELLSRWWTDHIVGDKPPDADATTSTKSALEALYPLDSGEEVQLGDEALEWAAVREEASSEIKKYEAQRLEAENNLKALIGDATVACLPDGTRFTWKQQTRKAYAVDERSFRVLRRKGRNK